MRKRAIYISRANCMRPTQRSGSFESCRFSKTARCRGLYRRRCSKHRINQSLAVVDGNVKRVLARQNQMPDPVNQHFKAIATQLLDRTEPGQFNQTMMELGANVCRPQRPDCDNCPVKCFCLAFQKNTTDKYPRRTSDEISSYPFPKANHKFFGRIRKQFGDSH